MQSTSNTTYVNDATDGPLKTWWAHPYFQKQLLESYYNIIRSDKRIRQSLRDVSAVLAELSMELGMRYVLALCLVSGEHCFVYHKMRNQMCFTSFSKTVTKTWPCPCVCRWREKTHDVNRVSENGPTNKSPLSNGSHQCIWDLKITNAPISKRRNMDPNLQW